MPDISPDVKDCLIIVAWLLPLLFMLMLLMLASLLSLLTLLTSLPSTLTDLKNKHLSGKKSFSAKKFASRRNLRIFFDVLPENYAADNFCETGPTQSSHSFPISSLSLSLTIIKLFLTLSPFSYTHHLSITSLSLPPSLTSHLYCFQSNTRSF